MLLLGRSVQTHVRVASRLHLIPDPSSILVRPEQARSLPRDQLLVIATGTQGEPPAATARLAAGTHPDLTLEPGDTVIFSSRVIPGHTLAVHDMICALERQSVLVHTWRTTPEVHVSGHASSAEQRALIEMVRPQAFMPVHGTFHHLAAHARLARELGVPEIRVVENGAVVEVTPERVEVVDQAPAGRVHVDAGEAIPDVVLRDRALLAEVGIAVVVVSVDRDGRPVSPPDIVTRGVVHEEAEEEMLAQARQAVADALSRRASRRLGFDEGEVRDIARRELRRHFARHLGRKPLTYCVVVQRP